MGKLAHRPAVFAALALALAVSVTGLAMPPRAAARDAGPASTGPSSPAASGERSTKRQGATSQPFDTPGTRRTRIPDALVFGGRLSIDLASL